MKGHAAALFKAQLAASKNIQEQETKELGEIASVFSDLEKSQAIIKPPRPKEDYHKVSAVSTALNINAILKKRRGIP